MKFREFLAMVLEESSSFLWRNVDKQTEGFVKKRQSKKVLGETFPSTFFYTKSTNNFKHSQIKLNIRKNKAVINSSMFIKWDFNIDIYNYFSTLIPWIFAFMTLSGTINRFSSRIVYYSTSPYFHCPTKRNLSVDG